MAESVALPNFVRCGGLQLHDDGPLWMKKVKREMRENGHTISDNDMFLAISHILRGGDWDFTQQILLLLHPGMEDILAKMTAKTDITRTEFRRLTKAISNCFPPKRVPSNLTQHLFHLSPRDQLFELHQYEGEPMNDYYNRALRLRDILPLTTYVAAQILVVNFIEGLSDPVLASLTFQIQEREQEGRGGISTLEEVLPWILEAATEQNIRARAAAKAWKRMEAEEKRFIKMWYKDGVTGDEEVGLYASTKRFFGKLKEKWAAVRTRNT